MSRNPSYYRARIEVIEDLIKSLGNERVNDVTLLRNGVFPENIDSEKLIDEKLNKNSYSEEPLTFFELTRYNTWFNIYPEKVCGVEYITTSRTFPIQIKGTKEDIIKTIHTEDDQLELEALALEVELQLLKI